MLPSLRSSVVISRLLPLLLLMLATRFHHIGSAWHLPDASWAVFFLGGFYLRRAQFPLLIAAAVAIDFSFFALGGSTYCLSVAYGFLLPAYAALWFAGEWLSRQREHNARFFALAAACWWVSASVAYLLSNGSFYWLSGRAVDPSLGHYVAQAQIWYAPFVARPMFYLIGAALVHFSVVQARRRSGANREFVGH